MSEVRHVKKSERLQKDVGAGRTCDNITDDKAARERALKELEALTCEVGRIHKRIATLAEILKAA